MKIILVPTDFSANSLKALKFAIQAASKSKAKIVLMHQTSILELAPDSAFTGLYVPTYVDQLQYSKNALSKFRKKALAGFKGKADESMIEAEVVPGVGTVDIILETRKRVKADVIIMGTTGASGLKRLFIGSVAAQVVEKSPVPVIVIPESHRKTPIKKIGYASDLTHISKDLDQIAPIAEVFGAHVEIFHIEPTFPTSDAFLKFKPETEIPELAKKFNHLNLKYRVVKTKFDNDFYAGIESYRRNQKPDMLAVITHKRGWIGKIFDPSKSKGLAYHTKLPVISIK
jgi:nucleotide-binding universal stress UspA family protein